MRSRIRVEGARGPIPLVLADLPIAAGPGRLDLPRPALGLVLHPSFPALLALRRGGSEGAAEKEGRVLALCFPEGLRAIREGLGPEALGLGLVLDAESWPDRALAPPAAEIERAAACLEELGREAAARDPEAPLAARLALASFLVRAQRMLRAPPRDGSCARPARGAAPPERGLAAADREPPWSVEQALAWVELHFAEDISFPRLVGRCATNAGDFSRRFKALAGRPLFEEANRLRIRRACALLREGEDSVTEIAFAVGYYSLSFFNRYFRRLVGTSPSAYRREQRAG